MPIIKKFVFPLFGLLIVALLWIFASAFIPESHQENPLEPSQGPDEFVLFTMPKTGTHLMRPLLEYMTEQNSMSYWSKEVDYPKSYLYDKNMTDLLLLLPNVVQAYWLHQPIPKNTFVSVLDHLHYCNDFLVTHAPFSTEMENTLKERKNGLEKNVKKSSN